MSRRDEIAASRIRDNLAKFPKYPYGDLFPRGGWKPHIAGPDGKCVHPKECERIECHDAYADEKFETKRPRPRPAHVPLMVRAVESRKKPGTVVAFIGKQLCLFENDTPEHLIPKVGETLEVFVSRAFYNRHPDTNAYNIRDVRVLLLRPVTGYKLIPHSGFECSGSMCSTTATSYDENGEPGPWLTPGRTDIFEASNVNSGWTWKVKYTPKRPGFVWVNEARFNAGEFPLRAEGVSRLEDTLYFEGIKK